VGGENILEGKKGEKLSNPRSYGVTNDKEPFPPEGRSFFGQEKGGQIRRKGKREMPPIQEEGGGVFTGIENLFRLLIRRKLKKKKFKRNRKTRVCL